MSNSRRTFLQSSAGLAALGAIGGGILTGVKEPLAAGVTARESDRLNQRMDGTYDVVDLAKPTWTLGIVQSRVHSFDASNTKQGLRRNLDHMLHLIDNSFYYGPKPDLLFFHEFPLQGWRKWTRKEAHQLSIELPGEETAELSKKAKDYNTWIAFGAYVRDPDWPGHVLSITSLINNQGEIVAKHWKARNVKGVFSGFELFTTTTFDVLDRYVEMYGRDAVIPVARTPLGNISLSSTQSEPEIFRASAIKGAEIFLRTATGGFSPLDMAATSYYNKTYTAIVNNSVSPDNGPFFDDPGGGAGGTALYAPDGKIIAEARGKNEQLVLGKIAIAELRATHRQPVIHMEMFRDIYDGYVGKYPPNLWLDYVPDSLEDAGRYVADKTRWK